MTRNEAKAFFDDIAKMRDAADDALASLAVNVFPILSEDGKLIKAGTRINCNGVIKRAAVDLYDTAENSPTSAPTLWEDLLYREGYRIIPETITAGTSFAKDELGWWGDALYKSLTDGNVWNPGQYAAAWELV